MWLQLAPNCVAEGDLELTIFLPPKVLVLYVCSTMPGLTSVCLLFPLPQCLFLELLLLKSSEPALFLGWP